MKYVLVDTYVSRYEYDTADQHGLAYMPHFGSPGQPLGQPAHGVAGLLNSPSADNVRLSPRPMVGAHAQQRGTTGLKHVERVWFNSAKVQWTYLVVLPSQRRWQHLQYHGAMGHTGLRRKNLLFHSSNASGRVAARCEPEPDQELTGALQNGSRHIR